MRPCMVMWILLTVGHWSQALPRISNKSMVAPLGVKPKTTKNIASIFNRIATPKPKTTKNIASIFNRIATPKPKTTKNIASIFNGIATPKPKTTKSIASIFNRIATPKPKTTKSVASIFSAGFRKLPERVTEKVDVPKLTLAGAGAAKPKPDDSRKFIIRLKSSINAARATSTLNAAIKSFNRGQPSHVLKSKKVTKNIDVGRSKFLTMEADVSDMEKLKKNPYVAYIEQNVRVYPASFCRVVNSRVKSWGLDLLDSRSGKPDKKYRPFGNDGQDVYVYVLDSGVRSTHSEFGKRVIVGKSFVSGQLSSDDGNGHGTHIASIVGGKTLGVARKVKIVAVKILTDDGYGTLIDVIEAMNYAIKDCKKRRRPCVINLSVTAESISNAWEEVIKEANKQGIVVSAAAGNRDKDACLGSPGHSPHAIVIAGTEYESRKTRFASYSNYGKCVSIMAPGTEILGASHESNTRDTRLSGTSQATAFVSGAAALFLSAVPSLTPAYVKLLLQIWSTPGKVNSVPKNTPNKMLYVGC